MQTLEGLYRGLLAGLAAFAGLVFGLTALLTSVNVVVRAGFSGSILGLFDVIEYGLMAATFLAAPWVLARNGHVTVDIGLMALSDPLRRRVDRFTNLLGAALCAVVVWYSLSAALASAARGSMIRTTFVIPEWWVLSVLPVAMGLMMIEFLLRSRRGVTAERQPVDL